MKPVSLQANRSIHSTNLLQLILLFCGILSTVVYVAANVACVILYEGYSVADQTVSELSAIGAPTRELWVTLMTIYGLLVLAFGLGVLQSAHGNRKLVVVAFALVIDAFIGFFWPPMHTREVLAAGGGTTSDMLHIVFTFIAIPLMMVAIGFGAGAFGKSFRIYSIITLVILVAAGTITGIQGPKISADQPTPWIGVWERINIGVYMLWIVVLSVQLLRKEKTL